MHGEGLLTVVGSGTLLPDGGRGSASFHVQAGDHSLLVDAGPGTHHGLPRVGVPWRSIDTVALSHFHPDHIVDVPALLAAFRFEGLEAPLTLVGPVGLSDLLERMAALHGPWILEPSRPLTVVELEEEERWSPDDGELSLEVVSTPHTEESVAFRVEGRGWSVGYTGDTGPSPGLHDFLGRCTVLVAECSLEDPPEMDTHLSPSSVADLASAARPGLLVVSHVYPPLRPREAVEAIAERYDGRVLAARDGLAVRLSAEGATVDRPLSLP